MKRAAWLLAFVASCAIETPKMRMPDTDPLAVAQRSSDFASYAVHRVGLVPFGGVELNAQQAGVLQSAFATELGSAASFEIVALDSRDLDGVVSSQPFRRGYYEPRTIIELAKRFRLDALLVGTVTQLRTYSPQVLGLEIELVSAETGQAIWTSSVSLDSGDERVKHAISVWCNNQRESTVTPENLELVLLSPSRFARFAAHEVARVF